MNKGESYRFNTNAAAKYGPNVKCLVTYKRQEDEDRLRGAVQLGSWGQGEKEANVKRTKCHHFEALLQVKQEEEWRRSFLYCGMFLSSAFIQIQNAKELIVV